MRPACALAIAATLAGCGGAASRWVEAAREANARADALVEAGDRARAAEALLAFVSAKPPAAVAPADARAVMQDAYARLATLALEGRRPAEALAYADSGLGLGDGRDVFASSLRLVRGRACEGLGRDAEAAQEYEEAQRIAAALLEELTGDGGVR